MELVLPCNSPAYTQLLVFYFQYGNIQAVLLYCHLYDSKKMAACFHDGKISKGILSSLGAVQDILRFFFIRCSSTQIALDVALGRQMNVLP